MKITLSVILLLCIVFLFGCGSGQPEDAGQWYGYGAEITKPETKLAVSYAVEHLTEYADETVVIEGVIKQVCQSRGCWMVIEEGGKSIRVRFADYGFFVPWESAGKPVIVEGALSIETVSEERARHWAEEAGDPDINPEDIHGDQEVVIIMATGVSIRGGTPITDEQNEIIGDAGGHEHTH
jgi:hypothetical protein